MKSATLIGLLAFLFSSCYYDSEEFLFPDINPETCDTTNVTFSGTIQPVLQSVCYRCHSSSNSSQGGSIKLEDYADVKLRADDGSLFGSISHASGYSPMPKGGGKLDDCTLAWFYIWIDSGSPDN